MANGDNGKSSGRLLFRRVNHVSHGASQRVGQWTKHQVAEAYIRGYARWQEKFIFNPNPAGIEAIRRPHEYDALKPFEVREDIVTTSDGQKIVTWTHIGKKDQPHFFTFHGIEGHWGAHASGVTESHRPLNFLRDIAASDAGFTAVHLRCYGRSAQQHNKHVLPGEQGFMRDIEAAAAAMLKDPDIRDKDIISTGSSQGAAHAAMSMQALIGQGKPPRMLALINPYTSMTDTAIRDLPKLAAYRGIDPQWTTQHIPPERTAALLRHPFNTKAHIETMLSPTATSLVVITSNHDEIIPPHDSDILAEAARKRGCEVHHHRMECGHYDWKSKEVIASILGAYHAEQQHPDTFRRRVQMRIKTTARGAYRLSSEDSSPSR